jgi:hypothetical protein
MDPEQGPTKLELTREVVVSKMRKFSDNRTDEVGYKYSEYAKKGPRKT